MAASITSDAPVLSSGTEPDGPFDPFTSASTAASAPHHRFSNFDHQLFALGPGSSPEQAKRALEAHLAETERRMEEAGKLGTALVQQRQELSDRLKEVEKLKAESELGPELRQKLLDIEKDYNDVARETARAFLPKSRVPSNETAGMAAGSPFVPQGQGGRRSVSPSKFESQATGSPTKFGVPNRKIRNQPQNRIHDIEFAAEISTSLIAQVRNLQALLAEREEELRDVKSDRSRLEADAENYAQRLKTLDESENKYKDENWNLETQIHDLLAAQKDASDREKRQTQALNLLQAEKVAAQRELDEVKAAHGRLAEEHVAAVKLYDIEIGTAKRNMANAEADRDALQRRITDLTSQNQELAKAFSLQRGRALERDGGSGASDDELEAAMDRATPEHSPPPSPVKGTPRHSVLESETLKTSLHHAQRTIQSQRSQLHREKTEKLELKRLLQDTRDELERLRSDGGTGHSSASSNRRGRKVDSREFKKPARLLGGPRSSRSEIYTDDPEWEEHQDAIDSPRFGQSPRGSGERLVPTIESSTSEYFETANENETSDAAFETANEQEQEHETSDAAFETANERMATETDDFQTGAEELSDSDGALTETDSPLKGAGKRSAGAPLGLGHAGNRESFHSTASTSNDEDDDYGFSFGDLRTPTSAQQQPPPRMRLRVSRGLLHRRSRQLSEEPAAALQSSPASFATSSAAGTPNASQQPGQSLFNELADFDGSDDESLAGTPSRSLRSVTPGSLARRLPTPPVPAIPSLPRLQMVDSGIMTDPIKVDAMPDLASPTELTPVTALPKVVMVDAGVMTEVLPQPEEDIPMSPISVIHAERPVSMASAVTAERGSMGFGNRFSATDDNLSMFSYSDAGAQYDLDDNLAKFPLPPSTPKKVDLEPAPVLSLSTILAEAIEPQAEPEPLPPAPPVLNMTSLLTEAIEPISEPETPAPAPPALSMSTIVSEELEPQAEIAPPAPLPAALAFSDIQTEQVEPVTPKKPSTPILSLSSILAEDVEPVNPPSPVEKRPVTPPQFGFTAIESIETRPVSPRSPKRDAFIIPRDTEIESPFNDAANKSSFAAGSAFASYLGWGGSKGKVPASPIIAEDETRQSPRETPQPETPESQRPFKEISNNTSARPVRKQQQQTPAPPPIAMADQSSQTALTGEAIDKIFAKPKVAPLELGHTRDLSVGSAGSVGSPGTVKIRRSFENLGSPVPGKGKTVELAAERTSQDGATPFRRPGSAGSGRVSKEHAVPPLPANHREVIEAARSGSAGGGQGTITTTSMGPPLWPASAMRGTRPRTPSGPKQQQPPMSPASGRGTPTPRAVRANTGGSAYGSVEIAQPTKFTGRSRQSSVSSFASELDSRFNIPNTMGLDPSGFGPNSDPRMIQAITQTMIGEYLWKYTRKAGRGEMSENRHRRYFWVHPYTRTLYWSDRDPTSAGRAELRAKSVPIEAVRVVTDDNPMPPGLHRKSLVVISPGRTIKFTCTTGQRHETWFNALSYLLLRTDGETHSDAEEMVGNITQGDVSEFNPSFGRRPSVPRNRPNGPPSLSSYNSRGTRNADSSAPPISVDIPTLTPTGQAGSQQRPSMGTLSRLSGYWKGSQVFSGTFSSIRSRSGGVAGGQSIYEASEVHDSAEDVRQMIEKQDRDADRLENVRACCDGKHDVGTLTHSKRGRPHHTHSHPGPSTTSTPMGTFKSRA